MSLPPIISLQHDEQRAEARFSLPQEAEVFRGHFPNMPVLPGVAQIDWVMRLAEQCFQIARPMAGDFQVKFSNVVGPGPELALILEIDRARQRLTFEYRVEDRVVSSGRMEIETGS
jgi:3-hydroxymyristoyl/3-hydroxydecanoyl-(acyl carrier protein) dehydratases